MNFYKHHIGDYDSATAHLSWLEDMAYTRLMRLYYRREEPIPADIGQACRLIRASSKQEREAVETVLNEFFVLGDGGWSNKRCDEEIEQANAKTGANRRNGAKGGRPRKAETQEKPSGFSVGFENVTQKNPSQTPDARHQTSAHRESCTQPVSGPEKPPTREVMVCVKLREAGVQEAAPHHLTADDWSDILAKRTDEEIVEFARVKLAANPGKRIGLKYLAPGLLEDPRPANRSPPGGMTREDSRRIAASTRLSDFRAACAAEQQEQTDDSNAIEGTATRLLG